MAEKKKNGRAEGANTGSSTSQSNRETQRTYRRGEVDGRMGHPPAEATRLYLQGYTQGLSQRD